MTKPVVWPEMRPAVVPAVLPATVSGLLRARAAERPEQMAFPFLAEGALT